MECKICNNKNINKVINLGLQPLANKYPKSVNDFDDEKFYELALLFCNNCLSAQIENIINRSEMFEDYYYLSSVNLGLVRHFTELSKKIKSNSFVLDIGSNDGVLLQPLKNQGIKALGVDPSKNVGKIANEKGLETIIDFFSKKTVELIKANYGMPDVIVASSIFTHLKNPIDFAQNIKNLLQDKGTFILEIEYLKNFITQLQFERFYFDRPFYYSLNSVNILFKSIGMSLTDIEFIDTHGGSLRCFISNTENADASERVKKTIYKEKQLMNQKFLIDFNTTIFTEAKKFKNELIKLKNDGKKIIGYGAPARVSTITNVAEIGEELIEYIIDDSPLKQNRFSPGRHIPIFSKEKLIHENVDIMIVFAYDYFKDINKKTAQLNCEYYKPIPFTKLI